MTKQLIIRAFGLLFLSALAFAVHAQPARFVEGSHFFELSKPVRTSDPGKIEVTEVFWYGCPHCYAFEPLLDSWVAKLPADVTLVRSPGMWNQTMETHAQIFYAAKALGVLDEIHEAAFTEIHRKQNYLQDEEAVRKLFTDHGVAAADFDKTWSSFSIASQVKKAGANMRDYGVRGVPNMVVNGKYRVGTGSPGVLRNMDEVLEVVDYLIARERGEN